jgi:pimeloyl-ACP methyl ester carboxylesterase
VLLVIPGGPGAGVSETVGGETRTAQHIEELAQQYDVVTFDPRGIGESSPILCASNAVPPASAPVTSLPSPADFDRIANANAALFGTCFAAAGDLMAHLSAMDTAADIERIRQALTPNDGLVAYGASYGTVHGEAYLERYGDHVKALVLDAVVDHSVDFSTLLTRNVLSVKDAFDRFTQWCTQDSTCALHGVDLGAVFDAAVTTAPATRTVVPQLLATGPDPQLGWPALAQMLVQVNRGDTSKLDALSTTASLSSTAADPRKVAGKAVSLLACSVPTSGRSVTTPPCPLLPLPLLCRRPLCLEILGRDTAGPRHSERRTVRRLAQRSQQPTAPSSDRAASQRHGSEPHTRPGHTAHQCPLNVATDSGCATADRRRGRPPKPHPVGLRVQDRGPLPG